MKRHEMILLLVLGPLAFLSMWWLAVPMEFSRSTGMTWDEAYYYPTFVAVSKWTGQLVTDPGLALSPEGINAGWAEINELPPVVKWLGAACVSIPAEGWWHLAVMRLFPTVAHVTSLLLCYFIARRRLDRISAMLAGIAYLWLPAIGGHARIAATETVFTTVTLFAAWVALQDLSRLKWKLLLVLACGLAIATKVNGIILVVTLLFWLMTKDVFGRRFSGGRLLQNGSLAALVLLLAPVVAFAIWPWLWHDTLARIHGYFLFIREHSHQGVWYFGKKWNFNGPPAPVTYPFVMAHLMTPLFHLAGFWFAVIVGGIAAIRRRKLHPADYLLALLVLAPFTAASLPGTPKYDGIRLFLPIFAPACILTAIGLRLAVLTCRRAATTNGMRDNWRRRRRLFARAVGLLGLFGGGLTGGAMHRTIDSYNVIAVLIGLDEAIFPFEQTYWGNALDRQCIDDLNVMLVPNARVKTLALQPKILEIYQQWGVLRADIRINPDPPYDVHLLQNRRGFWGNAEWSLFTTRTPLRTWGYGVREHLIYLYDGRPPGDVVVASARPAPTRAPGAPEPN